MSSKALAPVTKTRHNTISSVRNIIKAGDVVTLLQEKVLKEQKINPTWLAACRLLLDKAIPNLQHQVIEADIKNDRINRVEFVIPGGRTQTAPGGDLEPIKQVQRAIGASEVRQDRVGNLDLDRTGTNDNGS